MGNHHNEHLNKITIGGLIVTLGIIYGDIGTSPLYVLKEIVGNEPIIADVVKRYIGAVKPCPINMFRATKGFYPRPFLQTLIPTPLFCPERHFRVLRQHGQSARRVMRDVRSSGRQWGKPVYLHSNEIFKTARCAPRRAR